MMYTSRVAYWLLALAGSVSASEFQGQAPLQSSHASKKLLLSDDLIPLLENLTNIESISGNEKAVGTWLAASLEAQGYQVEKQIVVEKPERFNVFAWPGEKRDAQVVITSHIDTVPPFYPYKRNKTSEGHLISGRGSVDDKGSVAAQIVATNELIHAGKVSPSDVALLFVVGEEVGGEGMIAANDLGLHPQTVIFGEPTEGKLVAGHKGILHVTINAIGKAAHSGYPWLGRNANEVLVAALAAIINSADKLPKSEKYGVTTINVGRIDGGVAANVIPQAAKALVAIRIAAGEPEDIQAAITKTVQNALADFLEDDLELEDIIDLEFGNRGYAPVDLDHDIPGFETLTVNYGTDVPWLKKAVQDQKRYLYGPGNIFVAHSDHEALTEDDLFDAVDGYQKIILHALGKNLD